MTLIDIHFFIVDQVFHIAIERHIHFDLTMPVAGGHDMRCANSISIRWYSEYSDSGLRVCFSSLLHINVSVFMDGSLS
ncbi:Uncharacterised protein [Escherichia coli]|uniref:Uncharacterized protein n=1 Tax=Escherichia coli TaxID=562 RepID=A0A377B7J1_ECOLX|nr:Uncharacterised protein [Escherichia coli]